MLYFNEPSLASANKSYFYLQPTDWNNSYYLLQTISSGTQLMKNLSNGLLMPSLCYHLVSNGLWNEFLLMSIACMSLLGKVT